MSKQTTNDLIDTVSEVIAEFPFSNYGMDDVEEAVRNDRPGQEWIQDLARQIVRAVR